MVFILIRYLDSMMLLLPNNAWIAAMKDQLKPDPSDPVQMQDRVDVWKALGSLLMKIEFASWYAP